MKQTPSPVKRLWELAGAHRRAYALSIILAILGVACGMVPYFAIAYIMLCLIDGVTALNTYALWCGVILLGFTLKLLFSTLSTTVSHTATFQTLKEVRIKIADKLSRVPMGYIMDQSSGRFKDVIGREHGADPRTSGAGDDIESVRPAVYYCLSVYFRLAHGTGFSCDPAHWFSVLYGNVTGV